MDSRDDLSFEEFELKPLTEGLGFHKKSNQNIEGLSEKPKSMPAVDFASDLFSKPLPRTDDAKPREAQTSEFQIPKFNPNRLGKPIPSITLKTSVEITKTEEPKTGNTRIENQSTSIVDELLKNSKEFVEPIATQAKSETKPQLSPDCPSFLSMFLDATVISGLAVLFTLGLVVATQIDIMPILKGMRTDLGTQVGLALLVYSVAQLYLILSRSFFGQTLGEWSLDTQLGTNEEQQRLSYVFKLIGRTIVMTLTGFFILPALSLLTGKDLSASLSGLRLYRQS